MTLNFKFYATFVFVWVVVYGAGKYCMGKFTFILFIAAAVEIYLEFFFPNNNFLNDKVQQMASLATKIIAALLYVYLIFATYGSYVPSLTHSFIDFNSPYVHKYYDLVRSKFQ